MAMPFNDTTGKTGVIQQCELHTGLGDGAISGNATLLAEFTALVNQWYVKIVTIIIAAQTDWDWDDIGTADGSSPTQTTYPIATTPMVASQRDYQFTAALKLMKIKRVDVTYDGTNWYPATEFDTGSFGTATSWNGQGNIGLGNDAALDGQYFSDITVPYYKVQANSIFIYPMATASQVTAGAQIRVEFTREPSYFATTDTTKTVGFDTAWHPLIAIGPSYQWTKIHAPSIAAGLAGDIADFEARMREYYPMKDLGQIVFMAPLYKNFK